MNIAKKKRVGLIFLSHIAHIHHSASIGFELSFDNNFDVKLIYSSHKNKSVLDEIASNYLGHKCKFVMLKPSTLYSVIKLLKQGNYPITRNIIRNNYLTLKNYDALLSPHHNLQYVQEKRNKGDDVPALITTLHGMETAERFGKKPKYKGFDLYLLPGDNRYLYLRKHNIINDDNYRIIGYPKFDTTLNKKTERLFSNSRTTVLYTPHWNPALSSWYTWGLHVLDYFFNSHDYNLIFAPHVKGIPKKDMRLPDKYFRSNSIFIDFRSPALVDMTYILGADIYLGDGSSQVCEFIAKPRPCVFLNSGGLDWKNIPGMELWKLGEVVNNIDDLPSALKAAKHKHRSFKGFQQKFLSQRISQTEIPSGKRGALAISDYIFNHHN